MMKAVEFKFKSGEDRVVEVEKPVVAASEVLLKVKYSALDTATDQVISKSIFGFFVHARSPLILGWHYVGSVEEIGERVKDLKVGDKVWGFLQYEPSQKQGSFAEYITVKEENCALAPDNVSLKVLAAAGTEALTALQAMRDKGGLAKNKDILILGAGGGVGSAAVQIAKQLGAHVTAVCSTKDIKRVQGYGADVVIDRSTTDIFANDSRQYDVIFETPAKYSPMQFSRKLKSQGAFVTTLPSIGLLVGMFLSLFNGKSASFIEVQSNRKDLNIVGKWLSDGDMNVDIDSTYTIKDMKNALERQRERSKVGRVVIQVEGGW